MVEEIVKGWIDELCETNKVEDLKEVSKISIINELKEAGKAISNCKIFGDDFGVICNECYINLLQEALYQKECDSEFDLEGKNEKDF